MNMILKAKLSMPQFLSLEAQSLLRALFKRNPANRLGFGATGIEELKQHAFFAQFNWEDVFNRRFPPPFKPVCSGFDEAFCFDAEFTAKTPKDSPCVPPCDSAKEIFRGFSYVAPLLYREAADKSGSEAGRGPVNFIAQYSGLKHRPLTDDYELGRELGVGSYATCRLATHRSTRCEYAVKIVDRAKADTTEELEILLRYGNHPNIVKLFDVYLWDGQVLMVMEYLKGGELLDRILRQKFFSERETSAVMEVIVRTVHYLHSKGVVHRDLKPSNILYCEPDGGPESLRLCDFGFAKQSRAENGLLMTPCYSANFVAPEVLKRQGYDEACDIWSLGVLLYTMLAGHTPFAQGPNDSPEQILARISAGEVLFRPGSAWDAISPAAKALVSAMLHLEPTQRPSAAQILGHSWITQRAQLPASTAAATPVTSASVALPRLGGCRDVQEVKDAVRATFTAVTRQPCPLLKPVSTSLLAQRRHAVKMAPNCSTEV